MSSHQIHFRASNNVAEYEALINGLQISVSLGIWWLIVSGDSQLVINQVQKEYQCIDDNMEANLAEVQKIELNFDGLDIRYVPKKENF